MSVQTIKQARRVRWDNFWSDAASIIMGRAVDPRTDAGEAKAFGRTRREHGCQRRRIVELRVEPSIELIGREDDRHAVVDRLHCGVGGGGENREREQVGDVGSGVGPGFPQAREGECVGIGGGDVPRLLAGGAVDALPLEEAADGHDAAARADGGTKGGGGGGGFGAGVDCAVADGKVLGPRGNETPSHGVEAATAIRSAGDERILRGRNVKALNGLEGRCDKPEQAVELLPREEMGEAAAHKGSLSRGTVMWNGRIGSLQFAARFIRIVPTPFEIMRSPPVSPSHPPPRLVFIAPSYNHAAFLPAALAGLQEFAIPIIVVDDGSTDQTASLLNAWQAADPLTRHAITHAQNQGKAAAMLTGFARAMDMGFTHAITVDTDGQHSPKDLPGLIDAAVRNPDALIVGARPQRIPGCPWTSTVGRRSSNFLVWVASGVRVTDSQSGLRIYPLERVRNLQVRAGRYAYETESLTRAGWAGLRVVEVPITAIYQVVGGRVTHFRIGRDSWDAFGMHSRLILRSLLPGDPVPRIAAGSGGAALADRSIGTILHRAAWWLGPRRFAAMATGDPTQRKRLAASVGVGLFMATVPAYGIKTVACLWIAAKFRLHPTVVIAVSSLSTPPVGFVFAFLSLVVGHVVLRGRIPVMSELPAWSDFTFETARGLLAEWIVGSLIVGPVLGLLGYALAWMVLRVWRHRPVSGD